MHSSLHFPFPPDFPAVRRLASNVFTPLGLYFGTTRSFFFRLLCGNLFPNKDSGRKISLPFVLKKPKKGNGPDSAESGLFPGEGKKRRVPDGPTPFLRAHRTRGQRDYYRRSAGTCQISPEKRVWKNPRVAGKNPRIVGNGETCKGSAALRIHPIRRERKRGGKNPVFPAWTLEKRRDSFYIVRNQKHRIFIASWRLQQMTTDYKAGLDYSCGEAAFAVLDRDGQVIVDATLPLNNRDASGIPLWMEQTLKAKGLDFSCISEWSCGSGPGSFTGLRIASSLLMGLCFGREGVKRRSVSSASAIAGGADLPETAETAIVLYDGRKKEILGCPLRKEEGFFRNDGSGIRVITNPEEAEKLTKQFDALLILRKDFPALEKVAGEAFSRKVQVMEHVPAAELARFRPGVFDAGLGELTYLRPAVFVEPGKVRVLP